MPPSDRLHRGKVELSASISSPLQLGAQVARRLPTCFRIFGEAPSHDPIERGRRERLNRGDRGRLAGDDRRDQRRLVPAFEGFPARQHLVQDRANAKMSVRVSASRPSSCSGAMY
jgi:hypothetical protein